MIATPAPRRPGGRRPARRGRASRSILNFAPAVRRRCPSGVSMRKVDLAIELQILSFYQLRRGARPPAPRRPSERRDVSRGRGARPALAGLPGEPARRAAGGASWSAPAGSRPARSSRCSTLGADVARGRARGRRPRSGPGPTPGRLRARRAGVPRRRPRRRLARPHRDRRPGGQPGGVRGRRGRAGSG